MLKLVSLDAIALDNVGEDGVPTPVDGVIGGRGRVVVCDKLHGFDFYSVGCAVFPWVDKVCPGWVSVGFAMGGRRQQRSLPSAWV